MTALLGHQHSTGAKKPKDKAGGTDGTPGAPGGQSGQQHSTGANSPSNDPRGTDGTDETNDSGIVTAVPDRVTAVTNVVAPDPDAAAPAPDAAAPAPDAIALIQDTLTSGAGAVVPLTELQSDLYSFLLGIAGVAPVSGVIALVQDMLSSVVGAVVLLAQLPSDLYSFLLDIAKVQPVVAGVGGVAGAGLSRAAGASVASQWRLVLALTGIPGVPLASRAATGVATPGGTAASTFGEMTQVGRAPSLPGMASSAPDAALPIAEVMFRAHCVAC